MFNEFINRLEEAKILNNQARDIGIKYIGFITLINIQYISTISVIYSSIEPYKVNYDENGLYIGQNYDNNIFFTHLERLELIKEDDDIYKLVNRNDGSMYIMKFKKANIFTDKKSI